MVDVIEINAGDGKITKLLNRGGGFDMREDRGLRFESERNKAGEAAGLILQLAQLAQMIHPLSQGLDVSVEHGAGAPAAHLMPNSMDVEPFRGRFFSAADGVAHNRIENLGAAASDRTEAGFAQKLKRLADRHAKNSLGKMTNLNRGESFDVQLGIKRAKAS